MLTLRLHKQAVEDLILVMDEIGKEAEENGLTEDILNEILAEA